MGKKKTVRNIPPAERKPRPLAVEPREEDRPVEMDQSVDAPAQEPEKKKKKKKKKEEDLPVKVEDDSWPGADGKALEREDAMITMDSAPLRKLKESWGLTWKRGSRIALEPPTPR